MLYLERIVGEGCNPFIYSNEITFGQRSGFLVNVANLTDLKECVFSNERPL